MNIDQLIPDTFFISGFALLFLLFIYLPIFLWLLVKLWRNMHMNQAWRTVVTILIVFIALAIPLGDVYVDSLKLERLCEAEGGTHIYKTVEVDGFLSKYLLFDKVIKGYSYIESEHGIKFYKVININGENVRKETKQPTSRYIFDYERIVLNPTMAKARYFIIDRKTEKALAERINFSYYGGWLDRYIFLSWFGSYRPATCNLPRYSSTDFLLEVLIPSNSKSKGDAS